MRLWSPVSHNAVIDVILRVELPCHETTEDVGQIEQRTISPAYIMFSHIHKKAMDEINLNVLPAN